MIHDKFDGQISRLDHEWLASGVSCGIVATVSEVGLLEPHFKLPVVHL